MGWYCVGAAAVAVAMVLAVPIDSSSGQVPFLVLFFPFYSQFVIKFLNCLLNNPFKLAIYA